MIHDELTQPSVYEKSFPSMHYPNSCLCESYCKLYHYYLKYFDSSSLQKQLEGLKQENTKLSRADDNSAMFSIDAISFVNYFSQQQSKMFLPLTLAILIDLISAFLMRLALSKMQMLKPKNILKNVFESNDIETEKPVIQQSNKVTLAKDKSAQKANVDELLQRTKENIKNNVYALNVTKIMKFEKIGYSKAKYVYDFINNTC